MLTEVPRHSVKPGPYYVSLRAGLQPAERFLVSVVYDCLHQDEGPIFSIDFQPRLVELQK